MPGLAGVMRLSNRGRDTSTLLEKMRREMLHEEWYSADMFISSPPR